MRRIRPAAGHLRRWRVMRRSRRWLRFLGEQAVKFAAHGGGFRRLLRSLDRAGVSGCFLREVGILFYGDVDRLGFDADSRRRHSDELMEFRRVGMQQPRHFFKAFGAKLQAHPILNAALFADLNLVGTEDEFKRNTGHAAGLRVAPARHHTYLVERPRQLFDGAKSSGIELAGAAESGGVHQLKRQFPMRFAYPLVADAERAATRVTAAENGKEPLVLLAGLLR